MAEHAAFVLPDMSGGGTERLTLDLLSGFVARGARVDLVLMAARGDFLPRVPPEVRVIDLGADQLRQVPALLRKYLGTEQPQALLAAMWPLTSMAAIAAAGVKPRPRLVIADHCPLREQYARPLTSFLAMRASIAATYRFSDRIIAVSSGLADELADLSLLARARISVISNPVPPPIVSPPGQALCRWLDTPGPRILTMGNLKTVKNFALLIDAFGQIAAKHGGQLAIVGEGDQRIVLERKIAALGLQDRVTLPGFCATPGDWYASADLFALASDYEGFGNVLVEALHFGLPVVATDCPYGPAEILAGGCFGTLVPPGRQEALVAAISSVLDKQAGNPGDAATRKSRAAEYSTDRAGEAYWQAMFGQ